MLQFIYFYTSQLSAIISPSIDRSTHGARIWENTGFQLSFLVPPNKPVEGKVAAVWIRAEANENSTTQR
jgi:hypothetical protein